MFTSIIIVSLIGLAISLYTYHLEKKVENDPTFKPSCDINDRISCTKPMMSEYSHIFYFSNAMVGILYYTLVALLAFFKLPQLLFLATIGGCIGSVILAYFLYFKIKSLCILCTSLYIINIILLVLALNVR